MRPRNYYGWAAAGIGIALVLFTGNRQAISQPVTSPPLVTAPGADLVKRRCLSCHDADLIVERRLTRARWGKELDKMVRWGTVLPAAEREPILNYLAAHYADQATHAANLAALPAGPGLEKVSRNCLKCHGADIIMDQYLTRRQWSRELDKMTRWGGTFPAEDRDAMLTYLSCHFGPEAQAR